MVEKVVQILQKAILIHMQIFHVDLQDHLELNFLYWMKNRD